MHQRRRLILAAVTLLAAALLIVSWPGAARAQAGGAFGLDALKPSPFEFEPKDARIVSDATAEVDFAFSIQPGYHVYSNQISVKVKSPADVSLAEFVKPPPKRKHDPILKDDVEYYEGTVAFTARLKIPTRSALDGQTLVLNVRYQGCSPDTCFLPETRTLEFRFGPGGSEGTDSGQEAPPLGQALYRRFGVMGLPTIVFIDASGREYKGERITGFVDASKMADTISRVVAGKGSYEEDAGIAGRLARSGLVLTFLLVFGGGLLATLTPCVWPMIPITTGIVLGSKKPGTGAGFVLSGAYVLGMALVYAVLGVVIAMAGGLVGSSLQNPVVIAAVAGLFVAMALSMFGLYEMPLLSMGSQRFGGGGIAAAMALGGVSALVLSPCVGPLVVSLLTYVASTGSRVLGGALLFTFGLGMGAPLVLIGTFSGALQKLPRSGAWMLEVRKLFGVVLIAFATYFIFPLLSPTAEWIVSGAVAVALAAGLLAFDVRPQLGELLGKVKLGLCGLLIAGGLFAIGAAPRGKAPGTDGIAWHESFETARQAARQQNKPMMVDFYAEWCAKCRELDAYTYSEPEVAKAAEGLVAVKIDLTEELKSE